MRLDKFLKNSRLIKRRTVAKEACDNGRVKLNGKASKAGAEVIVGDIIEIQFGDKPIKVEIKDIIENARKNDASNMYKVID